MEKKEYELFLSVLRDVLYDDVKQTEIKMDMRLKEDLYIDSIVFYSLLINLEQAFHITLDKVAIDDPVFETVSSLTSYISACLDNIVQR